MRIVVDEATRGELSKRQEFLQHGIPGSSLAKRIKNFEYASISLNRFKRLFDATQEDEIYVTTLLRCNTVSMKIVTS